VAGRRRWRLRRLGRNGRWVQFDYRSASRTWASPGDFILQERKKIRGDCVRRVKEAGFFFYVSLRVLNF
jgi:hypothetical protein